MKFGPRLSFRTIGIRALAIGWLVVSARDGLAQSVRLDSAGARYGFNATGADSDFQQAEAFLNWALPFDWELGKLWQLQTRMDASAGWLGESSANAAIFSVGPSLVLGRHRFPLSLEAGVSPTVLTHTDFPSKDLGFPLEFTSHVGLNLDIASRIRISYRFQHMSNAGLGLHNPGLNLHVFGLSYLF